MFNDTDYCAGMAYLGYQLYSPTSCYKIQAERTQVGFCKLQQVLSIKFYAWFRGASLLDDIWNYNRTLYEQTPKTYFAKNFFR